MNYAVEITGCAQLEAAELEQISSRFRQSLELGLGGQDRVRPHLEAFLRITEALPGDKLSEVDIEQATAYVASHEAAELVAFDGRHQPDTITLLVRPAH
jgi:hypothetical protein